MKTAIVFWDKIRFYKAEWICTDHWKVYAKFLPEFKHIQSKAETYTVEGYNSLIRHSLARMNRKTKCYSKSREMLEISLKLFMNYRNNKLSILD